MPVVINGSTGISGIDGSATTPSFKGSDADTGIFYSPSGNVGITINSTQRVLVDTTGNTAITGNTTVSGTLNVASNIASNGIVSDNRQSQNNSYIITVFCIFSSGRRCW